MLTNSQKRSETNIGSQISPYEAMDQGPKSHLTVPKLLVLLKQEFLCELLVNILSIILFVAVQKIEYHLDIILGICNDRLIEIDGYIVTIMYSCGI